MSDNQKQRSSCTITPLFVFSLLSVSASATLTVLLYLWGLMGFIGTPTLSITACIHSYHTFKYSNLTLINEAIFSASTIAAASNIIVFLVILCFLIKKCSQDNKTHHLLSDCNRNALYFFTCLSILGSAIEVGYYLGYLMQSYSCTFTYDSTQLLVLLALGSLTLITSLILFFILLCCFKTQEERQEKYKQVQTKQTQPNEILYARKTQPKPYFTQGQPQYRQRFRGRQETKENIFQTPSKPLHERNQVYINQKYNSDPKQLSRRFVPRYKQENPVLNMHPRLASDGVQEILAAKNNKYTQNKNILQNDQRYLREEQKRYLNDYNNRNPILHAQQKVQKQRNYRGRDNRNDRNDGYRERELRDHRYDDYDRSPRGNFNNQYSRDNRDYNRNQYPQRRRFQSPERERNRDESNYIGNRYY